ncbi:MAG: M28 family peptidase [Vicinamibacteria bacterium]
MKRVLAFGALFVGLSAAAGAQVVIPPAAVAAAKKYLTSARLKGHVRFLASDLLEGRGPATRGDQLAQAYIASQFEGFGLEPGAPDGTYIQKVEIVGMKSTSPDSLDFKKGSASITIPKQDYVAFSGVEQASSGFENAELVFVGYGIVAPEYGWDDYKGLDVKGKVLVMMNNDPESDPKLFKGTTRLYYGRWDYKYEMAASKGAAGAIIIHTKPSAGYDFSVVQNSWSGELFSLAGETGPRVQIKMWATEDASRKIVALSGQDLTALIAAAQKKDFKPVPLGVTLSMTLKNVVQKKASANVIGRITGSDPALKAEAVIYTSHHDHFGRIDVPAGQDGVFNGAHDNALGTSGLLAIAESVAAVPTKPRRTMYFAAVAGEEQGLLGSKYLAEHPPIPAGRIAANINMDSGNIWGATKDVTMIGFGKSSLDKIIIALATRQGRHVVPDQSPDKGFFYRSDQFSFAKKGVPAAYFDPGTEIVGKPAGWGKEQQQDYEDKHYHQVSDELRDWWNLDGAIDDFKLCLFLGLEVANQTAMPSWNTGDEFEAARKKAIAEAAARK